MTSDSRMHAVDVERDINVEDQVIKKKAHYHLPGLFEFHELYALFLALYDEHREYFYDWCDIGSIYGAPKNCLWAGGRINSVEPEQEPNAHEVLELLGKYQIPAQLTLSNMHLRSEHLSDKKCNELCYLFEHFKYDENYARWSNGAIVYSDELRDYLIVKYPGLELTSSTTKVLTEFEDFKSEITSGLYRYVVPDFRLNKDFRNLACLSDSEKDEVVFLCNECCSVDCKERKKCYSNVSRKILGEDKQEHVCVPSIGKTGYSFSKAMQSTMFISVDDIMNVYLPIGFSNFKIEGRGLGSALVLEILLYYMVKPKYQINVREEIYLDNMLDLF